MKNLIRWLKKMEQTVGAIYSQAAELCDQDPELKEFLEHLAEDEAWHYHVMVSAEEHLGKDTPKEVIEVDPETDRKITALHENLMDYIRNRTIDRGAFLETLISLELTEWNDIFLYVVNYLKKTYKEFIYPAIRIQSHRYELEIFLEKFPGGRERLAKLKQVPTIWTENILIVDDQEIITELLKALLNREGKVQTASNGQEALDLIRESYFKLIVSDIDMPLMDGFSLYRQAVEDYPSLKNRFLFVSGFFSEEKSKFLEKNNLPFMEKPMNINRFRQKCLEILLKP